MKSSSLRPHSACPADDASSVGFRCGTHLIPPLRWPLLPAWSLAIGLAFLVAGGHGLTRPLQVSNRAEIIVGSQAAADAGLMVDMLAAPAGPLEVQSAEAIPVETVPAALLPELLPTAEDLPPEPIPELALEDLFTIPVAPEIQSALTPETPRRPPNTRPSTASPSSTSPSSTATAGMNSSGSGTSGATGDGGSGSGGTSSGTFPAPPYPTFARSRGMQGTVYLSIQVAASGQVSSVQIARSSGYSDLDRYASEWVKSRWKWSTGRGGAYRQPVVFKLR